MQSRRRPPAIWQLIVCGALALLVPACRPAGSDGAPQRPVRPAANEAAGQTTWDAFFLKGAKIGYGKTVVRHIDRAGQALVETSSTNHLKIERFGQSVEQDLKVSTLETPDGQLLEFRTELGLGATPMVTSGRIDGTTMVVETDTQGTLSVNHLPWSADTRGFFAVEQSLERQPLAPGEKRTLRMLVPVLNQVADVELIAGDYEMTPMLVGEQELSRVESSARLPDGNVLAETLWLDRQGTPLKLRIEGIGQESFRTTEKLAKTDAPGGPSIDLGSDMLVKVDPPLEHAPPDALVRYRVELTSGDPAKVFASGPTQTIRSLGPHAAELIVRSIRPGDLPVAGTAAAAEPVDRQYTQANSVLQIDDPRIRKIATEARGDLTDPLQVAQALERYVRRTMSTVDFSQAFATAAEVAESHTGDCTEHAVLLAALARACGIPSRVAIGLVYVEAAGGFGYHMWTEMYLDGCWVPFDATLGQGGIGAAHLKLVDSSLDGATAYSAFLPVAQVVGQLKITVLGAE